MQTHEQTVLLVSDDAALCTAARRGLEAKEHGVRVAAASTMEAAQRIVADAAPAVILIEETSVTAEAREHTGEVRRLESAISALAAYAPVVVIGGASHESEWTALVTAGRADFVSRSTGCLPVALDLVARRLRQSPKPVTASLPQPLPEEIATEAFGEVLRHELNNPLTGILGNAELLLAEVRRTNDGHLPNGGQQRLETIAALAVRLRETVRRLSQDWETRNRRTSRRAVQPRSLAKPFGSAAE
jgi:signal transduction histidine kinase